MQALFLLSDSRQLLSVADDCLIAFWDMAAKRNEVRAMFTNILQKKRYVSLILTASDSPLGGERYLPALRRSVLLECSFHVGEASGWRETGESCDYITLHSIIVNLPSSSFQHHCRKCGKAVCIKCSDNKSTLPNFGFEIEVRLCDHCFQGVTDAE